MALSRRPTDPKLDAVLYFLCGATLDRSWLHRFQPVLRHRPLDCAESHRAVLRGECRSLRRRREVGLFFDGEWRSVEREEIKGKVKERKIRLLVATDAACEGLNLQTLGTLINVDLPWNPSRLEQRIGRIKRYGQTRDRVDMLNLVYANTNDEKVYRALSQRMKDRYDLFGLLPDTIDNAWIDDIEHLQEHFSQFTLKKRRAESL